MEDFGCYGKISMRCYALVCVYGESEWDIKF